MKAYATMWIAAAIVLGGCGGSRAPVQIDPNAQPTGPRWNATLVTPAGLAGVLQVQGTGWMTPGEGEADKPRTRAGVEIANASPGGQHPWHVHRGQCGNDLGIFGPPGAYRALEVGSDGRATSTATLDVPFPSTGEYFVNVHASSANLGTIIACGNLASPAR